MRALIAAPVVVTIALTPIAALARAQTTASRPGAIHWVADTVSAGGPWVFDVDIAGATLTGTADQAAGIPGAYQLEKGRVVGDSIFFSIHYTEAAIDREIDFAGKRQGDGALFSRHPRAISGSTVGAGLVGGGGSTSFTVRPARPGEALPGPRAVRPLNPFSGSGVATGAVGALGTMGAASAPLKPVPFTYRGYNIDIAVLAGAADRDAVLAAIRDQLDLVEEVKVDAATHAFFRTIPLVVIPTTGTAAYGGGRVAVPMHSSPPYDHNHPILLHEFLHGYHDLKIPDGFHNAEILRLYAQARDSKQFPEGSYMLSNVAEYFAMMASVYLNGSAMRDPSTRDAIKSKQPDMYAWLVMAFGPM